MRWVLAMAMVVVTVGTVAAQSQREVLEAAREAMEEGQAAYLAENYGSAATKFLEAYDLRPFAAFLYNAGISYERQGDFDQALGLYRRYLDAAPDATDAAAVRDRVRRIDEFQAQIAAQAAAEAQAAEAAAAAEAAQAAVAEASQDPGDPDGSEAEAAAAAATAAAATAAEAAAAAVAAREAAAEGLEETEERELRSLLSVETDPADARITLKQGERVVAEGSSPFAETLEPGEYEISVEHPDYRTVSRRMRIRPGKVYVAILELSQGEFLGYLRVVTDPPGASVYIDDKAQGAVGVTPFQNVLATGEHRIWIERPGFQPQERTVEVELGETHTEELSLDRTRFGKIRVVANIPGADVLVDGERLGEVPFEGEVDAGTRRVTVRAPGMKDWDEEVEIPRGQLVPLRIELERRPSRGGGWAMLTLGLASVGAGVALALRAGSLESDLQDDRDAGRLASGDDRFDRVRFFNYGADAGFGLGAIFGLLSIYYFVRDPLPPTTGRVLEPRDWTLVPTLNLRAGGGGGAFRLRF